MNIANTGHQLGIESGCDGYHLYSTDTTNEADDGDEGEDDGVEWVDAAAAVDDGTGDGNDDDMLSIAPYPLSLLIVMLLSNPNPRIVVTLLSTTAWVPRLQPAAADRVQYFIF